MSDITKPLPFLSLLLAATVTFIMVAAPLSAVEDQGSREIYSYTANFSIEDGSNIQSVHWDFGFNDNDGNPVTSDEWEPRNITFPAKGTYIVTMTLTNSIGSTVKRLAVVIMGDPEVTFETNGGSYIEMLIVTKNTTIQEPVCTKDGYELLGWFTTEDFEEGSEWDFGNDLVTEHMTLYAKWSESQVTPGPSNPDEPTDPDTPGNPDTPGPGDEPLDPDDPGNPDTPGEPDTPGNPDTPLDPTEPDGPNNDTPNNEQPVENTAERTVVDDVKKFVEDNPLAVAGGSLLIILLLLVLLFRRGRYGYY